MKKLLLIALSLIVCATSISIGVKSKQDTYADQAETTNKYGYYLKDGFYYTLTNGKAEVVGTDGETPEKAPDVVTIPEKLNGYDVESMSLSGFIWSKVVNIPKTIKNIKNNGYDCMGEIKGYRLESINVSQDNKNYSSIEGVLYNKNISRMLLYPRYRRAKKYIEPSTVVKGYSDNSAIRDYSHSKYLEEIAFSSNKNCHYIGHMASCENLKVINIPSNVLYADSCHQEDGACMFCPNLTKINFAKNSQLKRIDKYTFEHCAKLAYINIPKSVKKISGGAFYCCESLKNVTLHKGLKTIDKGAFHDCIALKSIKIPKGVKEIKSSSFEQCKKLKTVKLYKGLRNIEESAFYKCKKLKIIKIPKGVKKIEKYAFRKTKIKKVKIPKSVKKLSKKAFNKGCKIKRVK